MSGGLLQYKVSLKWFNSGNDLLFKNCVAILLRKIEVD